MAQEPRSPWSRWDQPGSPYVPVESVRPYNGPQYESTGGFLPLVDSSPPSSEPIFIGAKLIDKEYNGYDPSFYNCIYGIPSSAVDRIIQQCHVDIGCCETTCCENNWRTKYGFALALLCLFCALVVFSVLIWLVFWLINRSRDKAQRKRLVESGMTPASSQMNIISPYATAGYPPSSPAFYPRKKY